MPGAAPEERVLLNLAQSAVAACIAETATLPFDTAKVRLQLQNIAGPGVIHKYKGPLGTIKTIVAEEGVFAPFKGLTPGLQRQVIFTGLRLGLYEHVRNMFADQQGHVGLGGRIAAALMTSALGITAANPADVVKVRLQAQTQRRSVASKLPGAQGLGSPSVTGPMYRSSIDAYRQILAKDGFIGGLYRGYFPNLLRNSIISATEIVVYDMSKQALLEAGMQDGIGTHFTAGITAGFMATLFGSPMDVIGTRLMAQHSDTGHARQGLLSFCLDMAQNEGVASFYKGFIPNFARIGSFNIVLWLSYEKIRRFTEHMF